MFDLYIGNKNYSSWSLRPWLVMKHFGIPFREHMVFTAVPGQPELAVFTDQLKTFIAVDA